MSHRSLATPTCPPAGESLTYLLKRKTQLYYQIFNPQHYVRAYRSPIVFKSLDSNFSPAADSTYALTYGGTLSVTFDPASLVQDQDGILLHPLGASHKYIEYGALDMTTAMKVLGEASDDGEEYLWGGNRHRIRRVKVDY